MAYDQSWCAKPTGSSGLTSGTHTNLDNDTWRSGVTSYDQETFPSPATDQFELQFADMSSAPGSNAGWHLYFAAGVLNAAGVTIDTIEFSDDGGSTWALGTLSPAKSITNVHGSSVVYRFELTDSWFASADLSNLRTRWTWTNDHTTVQRLYLYWVRLVKTPYTIGTNTAEKPSSWGSQDWYAFNLDDLGTLFGAATGDQIPVIPEATGTGRIMMPGEEQLGGENTSTHIPKYTSDGGLEHMHDATPKTFRYIYEHYDSGAKWTNDHAHAAQIDFKDGGSVDDQVFLSGPGGELENYVGAPGDKNVLGVTEVGALDKFVIMAGNGTGGAHKTGTETVSVGTSTIYTLGMWVQQSGNEHLYVDGDYSTPDIDANSGDNDFYGWCLGNREGDGRLGDFIWYNLYGVDGGAGTLSETNITDGFDALYGPGTPTGNAGALAMTMSQSSAGAWDPTWTGTASNLGTVTLSVVSPTAGATPVPTGEAGGLAIALGWSAADGAAAPSAALATTLSLSASGVLETGTSTATWDMAHSLTASGRVPPVPIRGYSRRVEARTWGDRRRNRP